MNQSGTPRTDAEECEAITGLGRCVGVNFARRLERENAKLRELGNELRKSADMIGYVQSADTYRDAVRRIKSWDDFLANTDGQTQPPKN